MKYPFPENKPLQILSVAFTLVALMLVGATVATLVIKYTVPVFYPIPDATVFTKDATAQLRNPMASLYINGVTSVFVFAMPAILFYIFYRTHIGRRLGLISPPPAKYWLVAILTMMAGGIFIQLLVQIVQMVPLPAKLQSLRSQGELIRKLTESFFAERTVMHFAMLAFVIAFIPAVCEELFFRGTLMNILLDYDTPPISAVLISGFTFAVMHFEFDNMLAIWCMGVVLGLLYYYSGSLWVSIAAHFFNNFMVIVFKYAYMSGSVQTDATEVLPLYYTLTAGVLMIGGLVTLSRWSGKKLTAVAY